MFCLQFVLLLLYMVLKDGPFMWDRTVQANILGAFLWPYAILQVPGSILVTKYGAHKVFGCVLLLSSVLTPMIPVLSRVHYIGAIVLRSTLGALMKT
ncbi:hypothetical protein KUTeg_000212 [Tegillarca granosa]|uniref:Major facilitator superfamily (MFS) profile domain-containing protein n=1 Tax=Tegillarca granosa TaxID=220873 RepID=A0ABQ9FWX4_TEGGR|nr:hypothetical protein KUTeg_000212 [Tegillarca granosa]